MENLFGELFIEQLLIATSMLQTRVRISCTQATLVIVRQLSSNLENPSNFYSALQPYWSRLSVVLLEYNKQINCYMTESKKKSGREV